MGPSTYFICVFAIDVWAHLLIVYICPLSSYGPIQSFYILFRYQCIRPPNHFICMSTIIVSAQLYKCLLLLYRLTPIYYIYCYYCMGPSFYFVVMKANIIWAHLIIIYIPVCLRQSHVVFLTIITVQMSSFVHLQSKIPPSLLSNQQ